MSVVVGTAGHIDHGKTTLLRVLTGIDADRLPEERRRKMTIDIGYAHLTSPDGTVLDFVDVPGHEQLVGNMLVGAGEIDAVMLVVAADDGPNAQTLEHLEILDALLIREGCAVVTKADLAVDATRLDVVVSAVKDLLLRSSLAEARVLVASAATGEGLDLVRSSLDELAARLEGTSSVKGDLPRLAIDRVFQVRGRGTVVTGSLRGGRVHSGDHLRLVPGADEVRVREVQVRGNRVEMAEGGRTALLLAGKSLTGLARGRVLTSDQSIVATSRILVAMRPPARLRSQAVTYPPPQDGDRLRLHLGTDQVNALVVRGPREAIDLPDGSRLALLRLDRPIAAGRGDRFALRGPTRRPAIGGVVLDASPPRGIARRRLTPARAGALLTDDTGAARLELHGALPLDGRAPRLAPDVSAALMGVALDLVHRHHHVRPDSPGMSAAALRPGLASAARRRASLRAAEAHAAADAAIDELVASGRLIREGEWLREPARDQMLADGLRAAMDRLETALAVPAPPSLRAAAITVGCPWEGVRALEQERRIVRLDNDLAWETTTYRALERQALSMALEAPLTPAAFRDATGTSRRYVLAILERLDGQGLLQRTPAGHVPRRRAGAG